MCLIAFAWNCHPHWRLVLAGNRDEFHARPSAPLAAWSDVPIIGGRDLEAGGTWLGVTRQGRCAAVTNVRDPSDPQRGQSRGLLAVDFLAGTRDVDTHAGWLKARAADYRPFNLLTFDAQAGYYLGNRPAARAQPIDAGVHGVSNGAFDARWPKTQQLEHRLEAWLATSDHTRFDGLFAALADERIAVDAELPDTGIGLERERWLSSAFIRGEHYGTRASTVVAVAHDGQGIIVERRFGPEGRFDGESRMDFRSLA